MFWKIFVRTVKQASQDPIGFFLFLLLFTVLRNMKVKKNSRFARLLPRDRNPNMIVYDENLNFLYKLIEICFLFKSEITRMELNSLFIFWPRLRSNMSGSAPLHSANLHYFTKECWTQEAGLLLIATRIMRVAHFCWTKCGFPQKRWRS